MRLEKYLTAEGETHTAFALRSGVPRSTISDICNGKGAHVDTALLIVAATEGVVRFRDLGKRFARKGSGGAR